MWDTYITIVGRLAAQPELKTATSGKPYCKIKIIHTPRRFDKTSGTWVDGDETSLTAVLFDHYATHVADSLSAGNHVMACGRLRENRWQDDQGNRRSMMVLEADEVGPTLRWDPVTIRRSRPSGDGSFRSRPAAAEAPRPAPRPSYDDPPF